MKYVTDLLPADTPEYMMPAWVAAIRWALAQKWVLATYRTDTGDQYKPARSPIDQMIDEATGREEAFMISFVKWFNVNIWGPIDGADI